MGRLHRTFRWANVILIFLTFFAYLSPFIDPASAWLFAVLGLFYPILLLLNLLFIFFWLLRKRRYALLSTACLLLGWNHLTSFVGLYIGKSPGADTKELRIMTYNIHAFYNPDRSKEKGERRWSAEDLREFYQRYQPDIWCFQEFSTVPKYDRRYTDLIPKETPLQYKYREPETGLALFSKYPVTGIKIHYFTSGNRINGFLLADVDVDGQLFRIVNVHLQTNAVSRLADEVAENGQIREKETWLQIKGMIGRYRRTAALRSEQAREIRKLIDQSPHPVILCGDFNDVPLSHAYHQLRGELTDGFRKRGSGLGTTFHGSLPALRIDYILSDPEFPVLDYRIIKKDVSDHYPVMSTIELK